MATTSRRRAGDVKVCNCADCGALLAGRGNPEPDGERPPVAGYGPAKDGNPWRKSAPLCEGCLAERADDPVT